MVKMKILDKMAGSLFKSFRSPGDLLFNSNVPFLIRMLAVTKTMDTFYDKACNHCPFRFVLNKH